MTAFLLVRRNFKNVNPPLKTADPPLRVHQVVKHAIYRSLRWNKFDNYLPVTTNNKKFIARASGSSSPNKLGGLVPQLASKVWCLGRGLCPLPLRESRNTPQEKFSVLHANHCILVHFSNGIAVRKCTLLALKFMKISHFIISWE
jgi:hypothetical protein